MADAFWVQENAPVSVSVKMELYSRVEAAASPDTVIASSTSTQKIPKLLENATQMSLQSQYGERRAMRAYHGVLSGSVRKQIIRFAGALRGSACSSLMRFRGRKIGAFEIGLGV